MTARPRILSGFLPLASIAALAASAPELPLSDVAESLALGNRAFMEGRLEESRKHYRYLSTLGIKAPNPEPGLALILRDMAQPDAALPVWTKASLPEEADGFIWNQRGWAYLALGDCREAATAFRRVLDVSTTTASQAEANLGLALAAIRDDHPKAALPPLREAWLQGPYVIPMAAYLTALAKLAVDDEHAALEYFRQSIDRDPLNVEAIKDLSRLEARVGENLKAWHYLQTILRLDPDDEDASSRAKKASKHILGDPTRAIPERRLSRPFLDPAGQGRPAPSGSAATLRVALFSAEDGEPAHILRLYFMANAPFQLIARQGEVVREDPTGMVQWEIVFRDEDNIVEVRDTAHNLQYYSKQPFRIVPLSRFGSVLIKSAELRGAAILDPGDRELRGAIEVVPTPYGFVLVNELPLEDYLYGAVSAALPPGSPLEAYKAQAVVARTKALWAKAHPVPGPFPHDLSDSSRRQRYVGLNTETASATKAVAETEGAYLRHLDGRLAEAREHAHCGGVTEQGSGSLAHLRSVSDGPLPMSSGGGTSAPGTPGADRPGPAPRLDSPEALERWLHAAPNPDRYCDQGGLTAQAEARWIRLLDAKELSRRARRLRAIGGIRHIRALKRSSGGRILSLEVAGSADSFVLNGAEAIGAFLSPGSLRSTLFTIQPLYSGKTPTHFLLWGAGTGEGLGLCIAGAIGQASVGRKYGQILMHYFPGLVIWSPRAREHKPQGPPGKRKSRKSRQKK
ncbi:MAG: hypothetical protein HY748_11785 [Elusimicrobia bacterium]|nr:hypothetical protein [Elusimicrobiota bacterium]